MIIINFQISLIDLLDCKKLILCMIIFDGRTYLPFHIIIPKRNDISGFFNNSQSLNSTGEKIYVGNYILFYFDNDGKLNLWYIINKLY